MSIVVTQVTKECITIGSDSAVTFGDDLQLSEEGTKLFRVKNVVAGYSGMGEDGSLFRYYLETLTMGEDDDIELETILGNTFVDMTNLYIGYTQLCKELGMTTRVQGEEGYVGPITAFHVIMNGKAWELRGYAVTEIIDYSVLGSASSFVHGALFAGADIKMALTAATKFNIHCNKPLYLYHVFHDGRVEYEVVE